MTFDFRMVKKLGPVSNKKQDEYITNASFKCKNILLNIQTDSYSSQRLNAKNWEWSKFTY